MPADSSKVPLFERLLLKSTLFERLPFLQIV
nr:MAG TPA: hypothetical protein [Caudoviricetes sp.]